MSLIGKCKALSTLNYEIDEDRLIYACEECTDGLYFTDTDVTECTGVCSERIQNCAECNIDGICLVCEENWMPSPSGFSCVRKIPDCLTAPIETQPAGLLIQNYTWFCEMCDIDSYWNGETCAVCSVLNCELCSADGCVICAQGSWLDNNKKECRENIENCGVPVAAQPLALPIDP